MDHMEEMRKLLEQFNNDVQNMKKELKINHDLFDVKKKLHVGGLDMSFSKRKGDDGESIDEVHAVVTLVVIELSVESPARPPEVVYEHSTFVHLELPYLSGYLGFREAPWYKEELELIGRENSNLFPQVLLVDGNGILHHEGFGSACHIGVALDIPTIGVAKQLLYVDGLSKDEIKGQISQLQEAGDSFSLVGHTRGIMGKALKSTKKSENPVFISVGHKIDLESAVDIVCRCCTAYRIPEPIRQADMISRRHMREEYDKHINNCKLDEAERQERSQHLKQMQACGEEIKRKRIATQS